MSSHPIHLIIKDSFTETILFESTNYTGYIPHEGDWVRVPSNITLKVISRFFIYNSSRLESVTLEF